MERGGGMKSQSIDREVIEEKLNDALTPGFQAEFDPDEADYAGAFVEDALCEADALESAADILLGSGVDDEDEGD
jgi:hypothetical protein